MARYNFIFDLFSHFVLQYVLGGVILTGCLLGLRSWKFAAFAFLVTVANIGELYRHIDFSWDAHPSSILAPVTVVQYNRHLVPTDQHVLKQWLTDNADKFDVVVLQEANDSVAAIANELGSLYPYQIQEPRSSHAFGMVILSRLPFEEMEKINFPTQRFVNFAVKLVIRPQQFKEPITIYVLHAIPPMGVPEQAQRNFELKTVSELAGKDTSRYRLMIGDWNITSYSPFFTDAINASKLRKQETGLLPEPTWPTMALPWLMQIPIDHILSSSSLILLDKRREAPVFSDHYAIIATFTAVP